MKVRIISIMFVVGLLLSFNLGHAETQNPTVFGRDAGTITEDDVPHPDGYYDPSNWEGSGQTPPINPATIKPTKSSKNKSVKHEGVGKNIVVAMQFPASGGQPAGTIYGFGMLHEGSAAAAGEAKGRVDYMLDAGETDRVTGNGTQTVNFILQMRPHVMPNGEYIDTIVHNGKRMFVKGVSNGSWVTLTDPIKDPSAALLETPIDPQVAKIDGELRRARVR